MDYEEDENSDYSEKSDVENEQDDEEEEDSDEAMLPSTVEKMPTLEDALADPWFQKLSNNFMTAARTSLANTPFFITNNALKEMQLWLYDHIYLALHGYPHQSQMDKKNTFQLFKIK